MPVCCLHTKHPDCRHSFYSPFHIDIFIFKNRIWVAQPVVQTKTSGRSLPPASEKNCLNKHWRIGPCRHYTDWKLKQAGAGGSSSMSYVCSHGWISICIYHFALLTGESFLCARHRASGQAAGSSGLPEPCPAHRQSLLTSTGPRTRLHLTHLDFVLMSTKPLAATQMELTEYSPYF